jgi:hypothetical protein
MYIVGKSTGKRHDAIIDLVEAEDYKILTKRRYFFNWAEEADQEVYKIKIVGSSDILGLVSVERIPKEWRIHIRLLTVSKENKGSGKTFENIAGNLITFVTKLAVKEFGELACVSLKPKGAIVQHYVDKFGMNKTGQTLSVEITEILDLINTYDYE